MGRQLRRALLCLGLLAVVFGAALHVGDFGARDPQSQTGDPSTSVTVSMASIADEFVGTMGPAVRSLHLSRFAGPDRAATILGMVALSLVVAGAAWARGLVALPVGRRQLATVAALAAPRAPPPA